MVWTPPKDQQMPEAEVKRAELMARCGEISNSDFAWLLGMTDEREDKPPPRNFKSWAHFDAFLWHQEQKAKFGRPIKKRKRVA